MIDLFFQETHDKIRQACEASFREIFESCFVNKRYGKDRPAKELIFGPLFEELQGKKDRATRQTACYVVRRLNERYMKDPAVVDIAHCVEISQLGIRGKICDCDFLMCLVDLINAHGLTIALGKHLTKAIPYFIGSVRSNMVGTNAVGKVQRDQNICASITILTVIATSIIGADYAVQVGSFFDADVKQAMEQLKGESQLIMKLKSQCIEAWKALALHNEEALQRQAQANTDLGGQVGAPEERAASPALAKPNKYAALQAKRPKSVGLRRPQKTLE